MPGPQPEFPAKKANKPVTCGTNLYRDESTGSAHGQWHATEQEARADKANVERSAENEAWVKAQQEAVAVADRPCPPRTREQNCSHKHSHDDPDPCRPFYRPAKITESASESMAGPRWRWHATATMEWEVLFSCDQFA